MDLLLVLGTSDFAIQNAALAEEIPGVEVAGFVENLDRERCEGSVEGIPVFWIDDIAAMAATHQVVCGLGTTRRHVFIEQAKQLGMPFATLVHPAAQVSPRCTIGEGCIVGAGAVLAPYARIGAHVYVNRGALIGHHTEIGNFSTISPGSNIAGFCRLGARTYIGIGAIICDHLTVGDGTMVNAGSLVTKDVPARVQVAGAPARIKKENFEGL